MKQVDFLKDFSDAFDEFSWDVHKLAERKGFWDDPEPNDGEKIALLHSELSEMLECIRDGTEKNNCDKGIPITKLEEEVADLIIRLADWAEHKEVRLGYAVISKHEYNKTRKYKHGKRF